MILEQLSSVWELNVIGRQDVGSFDLTEKVVVLQQVVSVIIILDLHLKHLLQSRALGFKERMGSTLNVTSNVT